MNPAILSLETAVPNTLLTQERYQKAIGEFMRLDGTHAKFLQRITKNSQINQRYSTVKDLSEEETERKFFDKDKGYLYPCTQTRNAIYKEEAPLLAAKACSAALKTWGREPKDITHVISVSCTGMMAPGIEFLLIKKLELRSNVERLGINFMGCFGAFKGLAIAKALALENPKHRILLVCTELCSLHFQGDLKLDTLVANSLFADGAAAAIIGCDPQLGETPLLELHQQASEALESTEELMSWEVGNQGYHMRLSAEVPQQIEKHIAPFIDQLTSSKFTYDQLSWAVHPGGAAILESIAKVCSLERRQMEASWNVLGHYGNMSSPTFLFVLKEILKKEASSLWVIGLGFGPGLSIEGSLMKRVISHVAK